MIIPFVAVIVYLHYKNKQGETMPKTINIEDFDSFELTFHFVRIPKLNNLATNLLV